MDAILLSIKPEYVNRILDGSKKYEFRKRLANKSINKILIYSTSPVMKIVGEVQVIDTVSASISELWEETKEESGIALDKFRSYFQGCKTAYAYQLGKVKKYDRPKELVEFNIKRAPQSFMYL
jgi:predicted transcriptional regulator